MLVERGEVLNGHLRRLYDLVEHHGEGAVAAAIAEAVERGTPRSESVAHLLHRREMKRRTPPTLPVRLPDRPAVRELVVKSHALDQYDTLRTQEPPEE